MGVLYLLVLVLAVLTALVFTVASRVVFVLDTDIARIDLTLDWLYPFFKATVENSPSGPMMKIFIFKGLVYEHHLLSGSGNTDKDRMRLFRMAKPENIRISADYGFSDPFVTGIACGAINAASSNLKTVSLRHNPNFASGRDYVQMKATAGINMGNMLLKFIRYKSNDSR